MPDFSTFEGIRQAREELYNTTGLADLERRYLLKEAEESILAQEQLNIYKQQGGR